MANKFRMGSKYSKEYNNIFVNNAIRVREEKEISEFILSSETGDHIEVNGALKRIAKSIVDKIDKSAIKPNQETRGPKVKNDTEKAKKARETMRKYRQRMKEKLTIIS